MRCVERSFRCQNLAFIFRLGVYSRKRRPHEPLSSYITEDIIKKCQRLDISDSDMMNIYINGLADDIKTHVLLNQPDSLAKAEKLARLREAVMTNDSLTTGRSNILQDQRIKELEGQVDLLVSLASKSKSASNSQFSNVHAVSPNLSVEQAVVKGNQQPVTRSELLDFQNNVLAALDAKFSSFNNLNGKPKFSHKDNHHFSRERVKLSLSTSHPLRNRRKI